MKKPTKSPRVKIKNTQRKITIHKKEIKRLAEQILKIKGQEESELSILFVGKSRIRKLNQRFRKIDRPTDVLAFSMREGKGLPVHLEILGDVVICPEIAQSSARFYNTTENEEIRLYLIHGILHLLGYKDNSEKRRRAMQKEEVKILRKLSSNGKTKPDSKF